VSLRVLPKFGKGLKVEFGIIIRLKRRILKAAVCAACRRPGV
jgi:hypothetical protein